MHDLSLIMLATTIILIDLVRITLPKPSCEISASSLKDFWAKVEKVQKTFKLCRIMIIDPS